MKSSKSIYFLFQETAEHEYCTEYEQKVKICLFFFLVPMNVTVWVPGLATDVSLFIRKMILGRDERRASVVRYEMRRV